MKTTLYFGSTLILALLLGGCQQATLESNATFASNSPDWEKAFNEPDKELGMAQYTDDAMLMPPNAPSMVGKQAIGEMFVGADAAGISLSLNTTEGFSSGDLGYAMGEYTFRAPNGSVADVGKYIEVHKRVNGKWLMHRDIYNSNLPPAAPVADKSTNEKALNGYFDTWNDGYLDSLDEFITENFERYSPDGASDASGLDELKAIMFQFQTAYPDLMIESDESYFYGDRATVHWTFSGTNTGPGEIEATGNYVDVSGLTSLIFKDGKITEETIFYDNLDFMEQLGYELVLED